MKKILNDFISLIFGEKEYSITGLIFAYGFLIFISVILFIVEKKI